MQSTQPLLIQPPEQMALHLAADAKNKKLNFRFAHCFGDEDGMKHLKCHLNQIVNKELWHLNGLTKWPKTSFKKAKV